MPTLTLTGDDAENYVLVQPTSAVATDVTINKLNPTITVGTIEYNKTFGDSDFTLDITDDNPEANVTYSSNDENVVTVSNGTVTIKGAGLTTITVSMGASTNYNAAVDKTVTVNVARATYSVDTINKSYLYARSNADSINLAELLREDCGTVNYASVTYNGALTFISEPKVTNGILAYTLESGAADDTGNIVVVVETQNYEDITITVNVTLIDQIPVNVDGEVELNSNVLTYGETLSGLTFKSVDFVDNAGNEVAGTLAWKEPSATPNAGTTSATWVFTPDNEEYAVKEGSVAIVVNKATPVVVAPTVAERVYNPSAVLADSDLSGGSATGVDGNDLNGSWSWKVSGTVPVVNNSGYEAVFTPADANYETVTTTITVTVAKATPDIGTVSVLDDELENTTDISMVVLKRTDESIAGTLELTAEALLYGAHGYGWKFTPQDLNNYEVLTGTVAIEVKDTIAPVASYKIGTGDWESFGTSTTYETFSKEELSVEIKAEDSGSGIASVQYYMAFGVIPNVSDIPGWTDYTEAITLDLDRTYVIYVKVTDKGGNEVILNSEGIVIYGDSEITTPELTHTYKEEADEEAVLNLNANTFAKITDAQGTELEEDRDYTVTKDSGTLSIEMQSEYLATLDAGEHTYYVSVNPQGVETTAVTLAYSFVVNVTAKELTVTGATATSRDYIANDKTVDITGITLSGIQGTDDVSVNLTGVKGTLSSANAGTYTSLTLPALTLTGADKGNYELVQPTGPVETTAKITVNKAPVAPNKPASSLSVPYTTGTVGETDLPTGWTWQNGETALEVGVVCNAVAVYTGTDAGNYETESVMVAITRAACVHDGETELRDEEEESCTEDGYTGDTYCLICEEKLATGEAIPATGHKDADKNHVCDNGCNVAQGTCEDTDKDHACDYGCDKAFGTCVDTDKDHDCDYGCSKVFGTCEDTDKDHDCDYGCDKVFGTCVDTDKDHDCDYGCDKVFGTCEDTDKDHDCDYGCSKVFGTCEDTDKDHDCDYGCSKVFGTHEAASEKHTCEYCGKAVTSCKDDNHDHVCDICGEELEHSFLTEWKYDEDGHWHVCSCGLKKDEATHSFTSQVTKQPTVHAEGERTYTCSECEYSYKEPIEKVKETPTPAPTQKPAAPVATSVPRDPGKPFIQDDTGKIGWEVIRGETGKAKEGETIIVDMNGATSVPGAVFDDIKGKNITITLDMGTGVSWTINGKDITASKVNDINFEVKVGTKDNPINTIPVEVINKITGEKYFVNISLTHDGELGLKAILNINLDKKNAGLFANLFYYNEKYERMQFIWADDIDEYGTAHLVFTHASEYSIVIDKDIMNKSASYEQAPDTGDEGNIWLLILLMSLSLSVGAGVEAARKKSSR